MKEFRPPVKNDGENIIHPESDQKEFGEFEYKLAKYHLYEAYQMALKSNELGYAGFSSEDFINIKNLYKNIFCEDMPEDE